MCAANGRTSSKVAEYCSLRLFSKVRMLWFARYTHAFFVGMFGIPSLNCLTPHAMHIVFTAHASKRDLPWSLRMASGTPRMEKQVWRARKTCGVFWLEQGKETKNPEYSSMMFRMSLSLPVLPTDMKSMAQTWFGWVTSSMLVVSCAPVLCLFSDSQMRQPWANSMHHVLAFGNQ